MDTYQNGSNKELRLKILLNLKKYGFKLPGPWLSIKMFWVDKYFGIKKEEALILVNWKNKNYEKYIRMK